MSVNMKTWKVIRNQFLNPISMPSWVHTWAYSRFRRSLYLQDLWQQSSLSLNFHLSFKKFKIIQQKRDKKIFYLFILFKCRDSFRRMCLVNNASSQRVGGISKGTSQREGGISKGTSQCEWYQQGNIPECEWYQQGNIPEGGWHQQGNIPEGGWYQQRHEVKKRFFAWRNIAPIFPLELKNVFNGLQNLWKFRHTGLYGFVRNCMSSRDIGRNFKEEPLDWTIIAKNYRLNNQLCRDRVNPFSKDSEW